MANETLICACGLTNEQEPTVVLRPDGVARCADCHRKARSQKPVSAATGELETIRKLLHAEMEHDRYHFGVDSLADKLKCVLDHKRDLVAGAIGQVRLFREDVLTFLRAFSLMLETVGGASTHAEKAARLRGLCELVETAARKVREQQFHEQNTWGGGLAEDVFRCDYPVRHYLGRVRELEYELDCLKKASGVAQDGTGQAQATKGASDGQEAVAPF